MDFHPDDRLPDEAPRDSDAMVSAASGQAAGGLSPTTGAIPKDGDASCHGGKAEMLAAARKAGQSDTLDRYARDYPLGPHDQPQSMCPAFGSLRVGLRMKRTATVLSGSACCVYGLTFTSHFYGARRTVGYVPFNSGITRHRQAVRGYPRRGPRSRRPGALRLDHRHQPLRAHRLGRAAAAFAEGDQRRPDHRHRRSRLRRADPCGSQGHPRRRDARLRPRRGRAGPRRGALHAALDQAHGLAARRDVSRRPDGDRPASGAARPCRRPGRADPRMARALLRTGLRRRRRDPPLLHRLDP